MLCNSKRDHRALINTPSLPYNGYRVRIPTHFLSAVYDSSWTFDTYSCLQQRRLWQFIGWMNTVHCAWAKLVEQVEFSLQEFLLFKDWSFGWVAKHHPPTKSDHFVVCVIVLVLRESCRLPGPIRWIGIFVGASLFCHIASLLATLWWATEKVNQASASAPQYPSSRMEMGKGRRSFSLSCVSSSFLSFHRIPWAPSSSFSPHSLTWGFVQSWRIDWETERTDSVAGWQIVLSAKYKITASFTRVTSYSSWTSNQLNISSWSCWQSSFSASVILVSTRNWF